MTIHAFEEAGLGKAPFRYIGIEHQDISHGERVIGSSGGIAITTKPGGTCDFCGAYIVNMFKVESADGNRFHVGCDCIRKVGDAGLKKAIDRDVNQMKRDRDLARIAEAKAALPKAYSLCGKPHPNEYRASLGETLMQYVGWLLDNGGMSGRLRAARMVELAIAPRVEAE